MDSTEAAARTGRERELARTNVLGGGFSYLTSDRGDLAISIGGGPANPDLPGPQVDQPTPLHHSGDFMGTASKVRFQAPDARGASALLGRFGRVEGSVERVEEIRGKMVNASQKCTCIE